MDDSTLIDRLKEAANELNGDPAERDRFLGDIARAYVDAEENGAPVEVLDRISGLRVRVGKSEDIFYAAVITEKNRDSKWLERQVRELSHQVKGMSKCDARRLHSRAYRLRLEVLGKLSSGSIKKRERRRLSDVKRRLSKVGARLENTMLYGLASDPSWKFDIEWHSIAKPYLQSLAERYDFLRKDVESLMDPSSASFSEWIIYLTKDDGQKAWFAPVEFQPIRAEVDGVADTHIQYPRINAYWLEAQFRGLSDFRRAYLKDLTDYVRSSEFAAAVDSDKIVLVLNTPPTDEMIEENKWSRFDIPGPQKYHMGVPVPQKKHSCLVGINTVYPGRSFSLVETKIKL